MNTYRLTCHYYVEATSESAARQAFIDGDVGDITLWQVDPVITVHDEQCDLDEDCNCTPGVELVADPSDVVAGYGYERLDGDAVRCTSCGATFTRSDGSIMRGHATRCPTNPRHFYVPARCWS